MNRHMLAAICVAVVGLCAAVRGQHGADFVVDSFAPDSYIADDDIDILPDLQEDLSAEEGNRPRRYFRTSVGQFFVEDSWRGSQADNSLSDARMIDSRSLDFAMHSTERFAISNSGFESNSINDTINLSAFSPISAFRERFTVESAGFGKRWYRTRRLSSFDDGAWTANLNALGHAVESGTLPEHELEQARDSQAGRLLVRRGLFSHHSYVDIGIRYVGLIDSQEFALNRESFVPLRQETLVRQTTIGPQLSIGRVWTARRATIDVRGSFVAGYGHARFSQEGEIGDRPVPGQFIHPLFASYFEFRNYSHKDYLSTYAELDTTISYFFTSHWSVDATARLFVVGRHYDATDAVVWRMPEMGIVSNPSHSSASGGNLFVGVTRVW